MKLTETAKRVAVFAYFDANGVVDDYIPVLVSAVRAHCSHLLCVVNGTLDAESEAKLSAVSDELRYRPNEGLDITAYKEGYWHLRETGALEQADELLFFNQTMFGPVYPLAPMFSEMAQRDLDFWGLTMHKGLDADLTGTIWEAVEYGYIPPHIQSYFWAVRRAMFTAPEFITYWDKLPKLTSYVDAVSRHEMTFTKRFSDFGFVGEAYLDCSGWDAVMDYAMMGMPTRLLRETRCPLVKRKSFFSARTAYLSVPQGGAGGELLTFLERETDYDIRLILQNLTRTVPAAEYTMALSPTCFPEGRAARGSVAAVYLLRDVSLLPQCKASAETLPEGGRAFCLTTPSLSAALRAAWCDATVIETEAVGLAALAPLLETTLAPFEYIAFLPAIPPEKSDNLCDLTVVEAAFAALEDIAAGLQAVQSSAANGILVPLPCTSREELLLCDAGAQQAVTALLAETSLATATATAGALLRLPLPALFAAREVLRPLAALPWSAPGFAQQAEPYLLPLLAQRAEKLLAFATTQETVAREYWNAREYLDRLGGIFATPSKQKADLIEFRMRGILDFYNERRFSMTLEQAYTAPLGIKEKLFIILRILLKPASFARLYRLLHGGRELPPPAQPEDALD